MASITIRDLEDGVKARLRIRAAHHGHSMEEEAREILRSALAEEPRPPANWAEQEHNRFAALGRVDRVGPQRDGPREPPDFGR